MSILQERNSSISADSVYQLANAFFGVDRGFEGGFGAQSLTGIFKSPEFLARRRLRPVAWCDKAKAFGRTVTVKVKFADFQQVTRSRSLSTAIARHDLLRQASVERARTLLPTAKGVRLLGVTVSNFDLASAEAGDELPLFGTGGALIPQPDPAPRVAATGAR